MECERLRRAEEPSAAHDPHVMSGKQFVGDILRFALPAGLQQVITLAVTLIDNLMIGTLGEASISAVSVSGTYAWLVNVFVTGFTSGAVIIAAQEYGNRNLAKIKKILSMMLLLGMIVGIVFLVLTGLFPAEILRIYSDAGEIIAPGVGYLRYFKYSFPFVAVNTVIVQMLRAVRAVKLGLYTSLLSCVFNVFFNWVFIFGNLGAPAMGAAGAGLGSAISFGIQTLVSFLYLLRVERNLGFRIRDFDPRVGRLLFRRFLKISLPLLAVDLIYNLASSAQTMITGRISTNYLAANSIVHMSWQIPDVFSQGVAVAASVMIGNAIGAGRIEEVRVNTRRFLAAAVGLGVFCAVMVQVLLPILLGYYRVTAETALLARQMGVFASITVFTLSLTAIMSNGVIKAAGDTRRLLTVDILSVWCFAIPLGYLGAFVLDWPVALLYFVLRSGNILKVIWTLRRIKKEDWILRLV